LSNEVVTRLDVPCRCGGGRLEVRTDRRARPVATVTHATGCPLGQLVADQLSVVVTTRGGGRGDNEHSLNAQDLAHCPYPYFVDIPETDRSPR